ncbi:aminotransferase class V [Acidimicrobium ferrooxidans DSM 10331]|uniref:Aminotransferase class V n=1 Tax=Acidimicrobium ferrooxidans (strain DSM 10331 / JCM 15462 / NBRC 103882 / ICP) TaxID=525909 RepID=C7M078_ACIFD|nr:aminotransferase class V-fold PLP-dependent enzyme [Acidimicrobium ferrooxidans]ACU54386.1 aminotransferase class V [Acidimicrobium ferrooxidans DSM 10331]
MDLKEAFVGGPRFLDTASYGLPPRREVAALEQALARWSSGTADWYDEWLRATDVARGHLARLLGTDSTAVTTGPTTSVLVALLATTVEPGSRVVVPDIEFTSNVFPWLVIAQRRQLDLRFVPVGSLARATAEGADVVSFSLVQSATGEVADLDAIVDAAESVDARVFVDATQALGWLPVDATRVDAVVVSGYKWLLAPRGVAAMATSDRVRASMEPLYANWYAGEPIPTSLYGPPLRLAPDARRFDPSPAWFSWVGAVAALELLDEVGIDAIWAHDTDLAAAFRTMLGLPEPTVPSAIVSVALDRAPSDLTTKISFRDGRARVSFHLYNDLADAETLAAELAPFGVQRPRRS